MLMEDEEQFPEVLPNLVDDDDDEDIDVDVHVNGYGNVGNGNVGKENGKVEENPEFRNIPSPADDLLEIPALEIHPSSKPISGPPQPAGGEADDDDETSPRASHLMLQFSQVLSGVGADDDDDDVYTSSRRKDLFTSPPPEITAPAKTENENENQNNEQIQVDAIDFDIWEDQYIPPPPEPSVTAPTLLGSFSVQTDEKSEDIPHSSLFESIPDYKENFNLESRPVELVVSKIPEELVRARHKEVEAAEAKVRDEIITAAKFRERDLLWREHQARTRVESLESSTRVRLENETEKNYELYKERQQLLGRQFRRAKEDMESFLAKQEAHLQEVHGEIQEDQNLGRKYRVEWSKYPQPIEMKIRNLRACKNKLPKGAYVLMLTQYDQLGGNPLIWSKLGAYGIGADYPATTKPVKHYGRYFDRVLKVDGSVFALCPPKKQLHPSNVFIIELFHLASRTNPTDHVVAWTALPIINAHFTVIEGKFRLPLIRGEANPSIRHFKSMEELIANDLNSWLCNIYIEINYLPRSTLFEGFKETKSEYEIEFDFMSKLLNLGKKEDEKRNSDHSDNEADDDFQRAMFHKKQAEVDISLFNRKLHRRRKLKKQSSQQNQENGNATVPDQPRDSPRMRMLNAKGGGGASGWWNRRGSRIAAEGPSVVSPLLPLSAGGTGGGASSDDPKVDESDAMSSDEEEDEEAEKAQQILERSYAPGDEFFLSEFQKGKLPGLDTLDSAADRRWAAAGIEAGKTIRRHQNDGPRLDSEALSGKTPHIVKIREANDSVLRPLVEQRDYDEYSMSLAPDPGQQRRLLPQALVKSKLRYLYYETLGDLFPSQWGTLESHLSIFAFIVAFWLRMYLHYIIQYLFLQIFSIPVYDFQVRFYEIMFKYMSGTIPVSVEFGVVAIGPIANLIAFLIFVSLSKLFYTWGGYLPDSVSQFVAAYGIATFFDPLCIFLVDIVNHNYNCSEVDEICKTDYTSHDCHCFVGDFMKLWRRMELDENSGLTGLLMTVIVYIGTGIITGLILYEYMVQIHKNGRILDIWRRVSAPVEEFFIPHDFEISSAELTSIIARAALWRGANGATRKLTVSEYVEKDPYDINFIAITKHYAIYEHELDGKRTLHRHFLMLPDGAIIEIFDQLSLDFSNQFKSLEKLLGVDPRKAHGNVAMKSNIFAGLENV